MFGFHTGMKSETRGNVQTELPIQWMFRVFYAVCSEEAP